MTSPSCSCLGRAAPRTPTRRIPALDLISRPAVAVDCPIEDRNRSLAPGNGNNGRTCPVLGPAQIPPGPPEQDRPPDCTAAGPPGPRGAPCWRDRSGLAALWLPVLALRSLLNGFISALSIRHGAGRSRPCLAQILLVPLESIVVSAIRVFLVFSLGCRTMGRPRSKTKDRNHDNPGEYSQDHQYRP